MESDYNKTCNDKNSIYNKLSKNKVYKTLSMPFQKEKEETEHLILSDIDPYDSNIPKLNHSISDNKIVRKNNTIQNKAYKNSSYLDCLDKKYDSLKKSKLDLKNK